jgi:hypothetical protein
MTGSSREMSWPTAALPSVWKNAPLFRQLREPQSAGACGSCGQYDSCRDGCMAAKFFTGLPLDGPDPECVHGYGAPALAQDRRPPKPTGDQSRRKPIALTLTRRPPARPLQREPGVARQQEKTAPLAGGRDSHGTDGANGAAVMPEGSRIAKFPALA